MSASGEAFLARFADEVGIDAASLAREADYAADPELALRRTSDLLDAARTLGALAPHERIALFALLGGSGHLTRILRTSSDWRNWLVEAVARTAEPGTLEEIHLPDLAAPGGSAAAMAELRRWRQRTYLDIGARDLWGVSTLEETVARLSATADAAVVAATDVARRQLEHEYGELQLASGARNRFVVLGMGKLGARELNYSSDVDLIFVYEADGVSSRGGTRGELTPARYQTLLAERITRLLAEVTEDGFVFRVDLRLRPDGKSGPLTTSLPATLSYYESFGQTWERSALFKARPAGGDLELGEEILIELAPFIYRRTLDYTLIADLAQMKQRIDEQVRSRDPDGSARNVKLGAGGIRELEFVVQSFPMVHGGRDRRLRERSTLGLLRRLVDVGLLSEDEGREFVRDYVWLRRVEHAVQIDEDRQLHSLPVEPDERRVVARRLGLHLRGDGPIWKRQPGEEALARFESLHEQHTQRVHAAFSELFRERRQATLAVADAAARELIDVLDSPDAVVRMEELGFADPRAAVRALRVIRDGPTSRSSHEARREVRILAPTLLAAARQSPAPDRALGHMAEFLARVGARRTFLALLAENQATLQLLINLFATSEYLTRTLLAHPELLDTLVRSDLAVVRKTEEGMGRELDELLASAVDAEDELDVLRRFRNEEFLRIGIHDIEGKLHYSEVTEQLSALADTCLGRAYALATAQRTRRHGSLPGLGLAVIALGKLGGREINYHSDLDLIFVYGPAPERGEEGSGGAATSKLGAQEFFAKVGESLLFNLQLVTREGYVYKIDTRLRPSGGQGALVTSLAGFDGYHARSSSLWERQALIRARAVCGPASLCRSVEAVVDRFVYGRSLNDSERAEIARIRGRMERELAREDKRHFNLKTGRGGLVDVEFVAQTLALAHGHDHPSVRRRATRELLEALGAEGLLGPGDLRVLLRAHSFLRGLENRLRIEGEHAIERIERDPPALARAGRRMGLPGQGAEPGERLLEEYDRHAVAVREIFERIVGSPTAP